MVCLMDGGTSRRNCGAGPNVDCVMESASPCELRNTNAAPTRARPRCATKVAERMRAQASLQWQDGVACCGLRTMSGEMRAQQQQKSCGSTHTRTFTHTPHTCAYSRSGYDSTPGALISRRDCSFFSCFARRSSCAASVSAGASMNRAKRMPSVVCRPHMCATPGIP